MGDNFIVFIGYCELQDVWLSGYFFQQGLQLCMMYMYFYFDVCVGFQCVDQYVFFFFNGLLGSGCFVIVVVDDYCGEQYDQQYNCVGQQLVQCVSGGVLGERFDFYW